MSGDLASRRFAFMVTGGLTLMALPLSGVSESVLKLAVLAVGICGTLLLMAGLVFLQKTHYAGIALILSSGAFLACGLNHLLGINSCV